MRPALGLVLVFGSLLGRLEALASQFPPEIKSVVAFVFVARSAGDLVPWGTAFFVGVPDSHHPERSFVYLVTAKHVVMAADQQSFLPEIYLRLNTLAGGAQTLKTPIVTEGKAKTVFFHPDPTVDLAVIPWLPDQKTFDFKFLPAEMITTEKDFRELKIVEGSEVFFTGLFSPYVGTKRNYPVVRFGRVALITEEKIRFSDREAQLYLIESGSYGGNSGAPVFFFLGADREPGVLIVGSPVIKLAGVMSGTFLDIQPVRIVDTANTAVAPSNMGVAAVVPAYKLQELLFGQVLRTLRGN